MDFDLNETQKLFKSSARELFAQECPPEAVRAVIENGEPYSEKLWQQLAEQGWTGLIFDEADGGMGLGYVEMAVALEEMGRALVPGAFLSTVALAGALVARAGNAAQRNQYLKAICEGKARATVAWLEASGDWNVDAV
ncbi:MAG TPA: acyl-CoA dehydrogenase family protein, partial [Blastocatellia bacterium]